jgi:hypothetical protein
MPGSERHQRSRLKQSLKELSRISPADLSRDNLSSRNLSFRAGLPYFERTLNLFRSLDRSNLSKVPSTYLGIVADHAERVLDQFGEIIRFTGDGIPNAHEVRNHMIAQVRECYRMIAQVRECYRELHDDVALLITHPPGQQEQATRAPWYAGALLAAVMFAIFTAGLATAYHYGLVGFAIQDVIDSIRQISHL